MRSKADIGGGSFFETFKNENKNVFAEMKNKAFKPLYMLLA